MTRHERVTALFRQFGGDKVTVEAAIERLAPTMTPAEWEQMIVSDLRAPFVAAKERLPDDPKTGCARFETAEQIEARRGRWVVLQGQIEAAIARLDDPDAWAAAPVLADDVSKAMPEPEPVIVEQPKAAPAIEDRPIYALDAIFEQPGLTTADVAVYCYLWRRAGKKMVCWPSQENIGKACRTRVETVKLSLDRLRDTGAVSWVRVGKPDGGCYNRYTLHPASSWSPVG